MNRSPRQRGLFFLSIAFAIAPFTFAMIRAFSARYDLRMLWMAFAALFGVAIVVTIWKARPPASPPVLALFSVALAVATVFAGVVAMLLGATAAFGIWAVAFVLSFCWALAYTLYTLSH